MPILYSIADEALRQGTILILLVLVLSLPLLRRLPNAVDLRPRMRFVMLLVGFHVVLLLATGLGSAFELGLAKDLRLLGSIAGALAGAALAGLIVFSANPAGACTSRSRGSSRTFSSRCSRSSRCSAPQRVQASI